MDRLFMILKTKLTPVHLSLLWGYIHVYDHNIGIYPRSQVSIYRTIGLLVIMLVHLFEYLSQVNILTAQTQSQLR